ncbi:MAG: sigma-70 family RNA polymerase sigma factor [candidate division KSB1 bacterium]|nr:sigma-70 family RNA polymerase sigma factor [candidate division KSB1 bacterium]MDZ7304896.1 sigma-70 family RNA polymerase sigma factor [candidate division KSB1 bacterium]MDZ7313968.1 sigma-70 family RNA polymerase sigma factor [candidate division KSB1 bacterium]
MTNCLHETGRGNSGGSDSNKPEGMIGQTASNLRVISAATEQYADLPEIELVLLAQQGDELAFKTLYRRFARTVYTVAHQMLGNHHDADEVLQQTFIRIFKNLSRLRSPQAFTAWVYQITVNLCMDYRKVRLRSRWEPLEAGEDRQSRFELATAKWVRNPQQVLENKELLAHITAAIEELPAQQKAVILLHEVEGLSKKMISEILDCSLITVRTNLHHARKKLRRKLLKYLNS